jgi:molybdopterin converting factor subunit 1
MRVIVKFFAILRDRAGASEIALDLPARSTVAVASAELARDYPGIRDYLPRAAYAVNREYVSPATELREGDELALIPPVSGG